MTLPSSLQPFDAVERWKTVCYYCCESDIRACALTGVVSDRCSRSSAWPCSCLTSTCGSWRGDTAPRDPISRRWRHQWAAWRQRALVPARSIDLPQSGRYASVRVAVIRLTVAAQCLYNRYVYCERGGLLYSWQVIVITPYRIMDVAKHLTLRSIHYAYKQP